MTTPAHFCPACGHRDNHPTPTTIYVEFGPYDRARHEYQQERLVRVYHCLRCETLFCVNPITWSNA